MTRLRLIGWTAMAACALGYGGAVVVGVFYRMDILVLTQAQAITVVAALAVVGEIGLWVGAGCLGLTIFKRRKALFDKLFRRRPKAVPDAGAFDDAGG